ncbi:MAG: HemK2/MTQ2 family protein methyltransferase [Candidatus Micrarchaeia archaeon]
MELAYRGITLIVPDSVYPPSEDSFMLSAGAGRLRGEILEVGCGSGIASLSCAKAHRSNRVLGVDINPDAVRCARSNAGSNGIRNASFAVSDLFSRVPAKRFDAIMFNPPYLPTADEERLSGPINHAYDGGSDGRQVLDRFLALFDRYMRPGGSLLLIQSSLNDRKRTLAGLRSLGYRTRTLSTEKFFFERLYLLKAVKP